MIENNSYALVERKKMQELLYLCCILKNLFVNVKQFIEEGGVKVHDYTSIKLQYVSKHYHTREIDTGLTFYAKSKFEDNSIYNLVH